MSTDPSHRFNDSTLYWRGSLILDAVIDSLMDNPIAQLNKAAEVVVGGGSAGSRRLFTAIGGLLELLPRILERSTPASQTAASSSITRVPQSLRAFLSTATILA
jgi:hypothetical protein